MKLKFLAALALSAVLLLSGCTAPAKNETTPESSSAASETTAVSERVITDSCGTKTELPDDRVSSPFTARLPSAGCSPAVSSPVLPKMP